MTADDARAQGEQDASAARADAETDGARGGGMLSVFPVEEFVPRDHRRAYLDGAASVLGYRPLIVA